VSGHGQTGGGAPSSQPSGSSASTAWPTLPSDISTNAKAVDARAEAIATALIESETARRGIQAARAKSADDLNQKLADTLVTVTVGGIERARGGAQFVQTAATALAGLYTGVLAVLFVADEAAPVRAFIPALFLGLAVTLATYYLAFVVPGTGMSKPDYENNNDADLWVRLNYVSRWVRRIVFRRAGALRAAVLSLFLGLFFLPVGIAKIPVEWELGWLPEPATPVQPTMAWPAPTILPDASLSVVLYEAQLEEFRENLGPAPSSSPDTTARDELVAWALAALGLIAVLLLWWDPLRFWAPDEGPQVNLDPRPELR
jgi:hypothetical protein